MKMEVGDIILVSGQSFISKLVQKITRSKWSHVALYIGGGYVLEINWNIKAHIVPNLYPKEGEECLVLRNKIPLTKEQQDMIISRGCAYNQTGNRYDFLLLAGLFLKTLFPNWKVLSKLNDKNSFVCTELTDQVLKEAGIDLFPGVEGDIYPLDFLHCEQLEVVYSNVSHGNY